MIEARHNFAGGRPGDYRLVVAEEPIVRMNRIFIVARESIKCLLLGSQSQCRSPIGSACQRYALKAQ